MKNNLMIRMMTSMILLSILLAYGFGQVDLLKPNWLWLAIFASGMGLQATFTGWCPSNLIGKLSKTGECCPSGSCASNNTQEASKPENNCCSGDAVKVMPEEQPAQENSANGKVIKVLGTGCAKCNSTMDRIKQVADELAEPVNVIAVHDVDKILAYGVMSTPAVVIEEEVVYSGSVPSVETIKDWFSPESA